MVVVDEIDATLRLREDSTQTKRLHYKIPMTERILCKQIAGRLSDELNKLFAEKGVQFEIDTYFTTQTVDTEDFEHSNSNHKLHACRMKEVKYLQSKYDNLLAFFDMNDLDYEFKEPGISGYTLDQCVHLDYFANMVFRERYEEKIIPEKMLQGDKSVEYIWSLFIYVGVRIIYYYY